MSYTAATAEQVKEVAERLLGPLLADVRRELAAMKVRHEQLHKRQTELTRRMTRSETRFEAESNRVEGLMSDVLRQIAQKQNTGDL